MVKAHENTCPTYTVRTIKTRETERLTRVYRGLRPVNIFLQRLSAAMGHAVEGFGCAVPLASFNCSRIHPVYVCACTFDRSPRRAEWLRVWVKLSPSVVLAPRTFFYVNASLFLSFFLHDSRGTPEYLIRGYYIRIRVFG